MPSLTLSRGILRWPVLVAFADRFLGLTHARCVASVRRVPTLEGDGMDATISQIGEAVVGELRAASYMESTIGQYAKSIRAMARYIEARGGVHTHQPSRSPTTSFELSTASDDITSLSRG